MSTATLSRPTSGRMIAGVCAGIAQRFGWQPKTVRLAFVLSCLLPGPQFVIYLILWLTMPERP
jgi:phage shock protein PspC (stress-responsive transcriptional regulator)